VIPLDGAGIVLYDGKYLRHEVIVMTTFMSSRSAASDRFVTGGFPVGIENLLFRGVGKASESIENARFIDGTECRNGQKNVFP
jgi:hypothetical protein